MLAPFTYFQRNEGIVPFSILIQFSASSDLSDPRSAIGYIKSVHSFLLRCLGSNTGHKTGERQAHFAYNLPGWFRGSHRIFSHHKAISPVSTVKIGPPRKGVKPRETYAEFSILVDGDPLGTFSLPVGWNGNCRAHIGSYGNADSSTFTHPGDYHECSLGLSDGSGHLGLSQPE